MPRYGVFTEDDAKKVAAATRRVLAVPAVRNILKQPQQTIRQTAFPGGGTGDGGGSGSDCDCTCVSGVTMPASSTVCCTSHPAFSMTCPLTGETRLLKWQTGNRWATDPFEYATEEGCSNEYVWAMTPSTSGTSIIALELAVDNGCDKACVQYERILKFRCQCSNEFEQTTFEHAAIGEECVLCITPQPGIVDPCGNCEGGETPLTLAIEIGAFSCDASCDWGDIPGATHVLTQRSSYCPLPDESPLNQPTCAYDSIVFDVDIPGFTCSGGIATTFDKAVISATVGPGRVSAGIALWNTSAAPSVTDWPCNGGLFTGGYSHAGWSVGISDWNCQDSIELTGSSSSCGGSNTQPETVSIAGGGLTTALPESDGACAGCGEPDVADPDAEGACCTENAGCMDISETDCTFFDGEWFATDADCSANCESPGSCCACGPKADGSGEHAVFCQSGVTSSWCSGLNGVWTDATDCAGLACAVGSDCGGGAGESVGACCCNDGECAEGVPESQCTAGPCSSDCSFHDDCQSFHGGQTCAEITCNPAAPTGACIFATGDCVMGDETDCTDGLTEAECNALHLAVTGCATNPNVHWEEGGTCAGCSHGCDGGGSNCVEAVC